MLITHTVHPVITLFHWFHCFYTHTLSLSHAHVALFWGDVMLWFLESLLCNLVNTGALLVGNVSEPSRALPLAYALHSPTARPHLFLSKPGVFRCWGVVTMATATWGEWPHVNVPVCTPSLLHRVSVCSLSFSLISPAPFSPPECSALLCLGRSFSSIFGLKHTSPVSEEQQPDDLWEEKTLMAWLFLFSPDSEYDAAFFPHYPLIHK